MTKRVYKTTQSDYRKTALKRDKALAFLTGNAEAEKRRENDDRASLRTRYAHADD